ncbi:lipocalin family protein [Aquimarina sp. 2201CG1-2-11]|uniref:lipocalin family protein n=1 Tax=Aquimarina discodermiae TaxID=3231043 RepID=UPI00346286C4
MKSVIYLVAFGLFITFFAACEKETIDSDSLESIATVPSKDIQAILNEAISQTSIRKQKSTPVQTVDFVELSRYTGRWYELANFPSFFSQNCSCTTADYAVIPEGISVFNNCTLTTTGEFSAINGTAVVVDEQTNSKLNVFFGPVPGDYWIIDLVGFDEDEPYDFSVVSGPDRDSLFLLSRTPEITTIKQKVALFKIFVNLILQGYDLTKLEITYQGQDCVYP